jgi:hypothetical protein
MKNRIKNRVLNTIAFAIFTKEQFTLKLKMRRTSR